jgi:hypothetical protein
MKKSNINRATLVKVGLFIILPIIISIVLYFLYRNYFTGNNFINKTILKKDMQFKYFIFEEFDSVAGKNDIANGVKTYYKKGQNYIVDSGKNNMSPTTIKMLDDARDIIEREWNEFNTTDKIYFKINSGYRTPDRNSEIGGVVGSAHTKGYAVDIAWSGYSQAKKDKIREVLSRVGFNRFGIANSFIHTDNDLSKPQNAVWTY